MGSKRLTPTTTGKMASKYLLLLFCCAEESQVVVGKGLTAKPGPKKRPPSQVVSNNAKTKQAATAKPMPDAQPQLTEADSEEALTALREKAFTLATRLAAQVLFLKPVPRNCTVNQLRQLCREASNVRIPLHERTGRNRGYAFVDFKTREQAERVRKAIDGKLLAGKPLMVRMAGDTSVSPSLNDFDYKCLFVTGLAREVSKMDMRDLFPAAERVIFRTNNDKKCLGYCFVFFQSETAAMAALEATQHRQVKGQGISVTFSKKKETINFLKKSQSNVGEVKVAVISSAEQHLDQTRGRKRAASEDDDISQAKNVDVSPASKKGRSLTDADKGNLKIPVKLNVKRKASELSDDTDDSTEIHSSSRSLLESPNAPVSKKTKASNDSVPAALKTKKGSAVAKKHLTSSESEEDDFSGDNCEEELADDTDDDDDDDDLPAGSDEDGSEMSDSEEEIIMSRSKKSPNVSGGLTHKEKFKKCGPSVSKYATNLAAASIAKKGAKASSGSMKKSLGKGSSRSSDLLKLQKMLRTEKTR